MYANIGDSTSRNHELEDKKQAKNGNFWVKNLLICL